MRLTDEQALVICQIVRQVEGKQSLVRVFGSRLDDTAHGGDLDLMLEIQTPAPMLLVKKSSVRLALSLSKGSK